MIIGTNEALLIVYIISGIFGIVTFIYVMKHK